MAAMRFATGKSDETHSWHYHNNDAAELAEHIIGCSLPKGREGSIVLFVWDVLAHIHNVLGPIIGYGRAKQRQHSSQTGAANQYRRIHPVVT